MRAVTCRVTIGALMMSLMIVNGAAPANGAIRISRDDPSNILAEFHQVRCKFKDGKPLAFQAVGREGGWAFRADIYGDKMKKNHGYRVRWGDHSRADVSVFPPSGPHYTNTKEPNPGGMDLFGDAGGVVLRDKKGAPDFGAGLPLIYDDTGSNPNHVTVTGYADCT